MNTPSCYSHKRGFLAAVTVVIPAILIGSGLSAPAAQAGYMATFEQMGTSVVAMGSGTIDLTDLGSPVFSSGGGLIQPSAADITIGPRDAAELNVFRGVTGPTSVGSGIGAFASSGSGDMVGIEGRTGASGVLLVPLLYTSGNPLSDTSTYDNASFSSLGVTPGTYVWTWGTGAHADSFTLQIGPAAVPAPLIGHGLVVMLAVGGVLFGGRLIERSKARRELGTA
jgi:hypothetical protein